MNAEFERQVVARFIEGLEDDELKKELWMHCRRGRQTIEEAYNRAVDYESSRLSSDTVEPQLAAIEADKSMPRSVSVIRRPLVAAVEQQPDGLAHKVQINTLGVARVEESVAKVSDHVVCLEKEMREGFQKFTESFQRLENMLSQSNPKDQQPQPVRPQFPTPAPNAQPLYAFRKPFYPTQPRYQRAYRPLGHVAGLEVPGMRAGPEFINRPLAHIPVSTTPTPVSTAPTQVKTQLPIQAETTNSETEVTQAIDTVARPAIAPFHPMTDTNAMAYAAYQYDHWSPYLEPQGYTPYVTQDPNGNLYEVDFHN